MFVIIIFFFFYCCCATINMVNKDLQKYVEKRLLKIFLTEDEVLMG